MRLVQSGSSYISQNDMRLHFGLGAATTVDSLEVTLAGRDDDAPERVKANQVVAIRQQ